VTEIIAYLSLPFIHCLFRWYEIFFRWRYAMPQNALPD